MKRVEIILRRIEAYERALVTYKTEHKPAMYRRIAQKLNELYWVLDKKLIEVKYEN